ncbi:MAG: LysM domain-containing protein [Bacillota bacterium]
MGGWRWPEEHIECVAYTVGRGDTLRAIAHRYYPDDRADDVVWAIRMANNLARPEDLALRPGDVILIPDPLRYGFREP